VPFGNVASIAAKAPAVIEIVTMRLMWMRRSPRVKPQSVDRFRPSLCENSSAF
jgi:hypothetical protein